MELSSALSAIKQLAGQGDVENALAQLLTILDGKPEMAALSQAVRVNQADFFQIKSQVLRGTISSDNARLANNQITDNLLRIVQRLETGKTTLEEAPPPEQVHSGNAWRYYTAGGIVALALAFISWQFFFKKSQECPEYGKQKTQRVMILPLKRTDTSNSAKREFDIADELNTLFEKDPQLSAIAEADVNEAYDIDKNYPNPSEADAIAANCGVEMIVWGKISNSKDTIEVRYKLLNPATPKSARGTDPYLSKLLTLSTEGVWVQDAKTIAKLIYLVLANQTGNTELAFETIKSLQMPMVAADITAASLPANVDTSTMLLLADYYRTTGKSDSAILVYNHLLAYHPDNNTALKLRGSLNYKNEKYWAAARDLQDIEPDPAKVDPAILPIRADAYLKCGWPEKARQDLEQIKKDTLASKEWIKLKERGIKDSLNVYQAQIKVSEKKLAKKPTDVVSRLTLAKAQNAVGDTDAATKNAEVVQKQIPKSTAPVAIIVEASIQEGDIQKADKTIQKADKMGLNTKNIRFKPSVRPLSTRVDTLGKQQ